ncbi:MAG TPA: hypothetical protein VHS81_07305, partial [Caulobacteraceae bacterium]|nr:hypothetical protein [Caulobacteraceae bacterium]
MTSVAEVADEIERRRGGRGPYLVGVTGAVAAGKSTFAGQLATALTAGGQTVETVCTDGFLLNNAALTAKGVLNRKGFPESYDMAGMRAALAALRTGPADIPGYSHVIYDIDPALTRRIEPAGVVVVEGLALHEGAVALGLDALIYLDADEAHLEAWFAERFVVLWRAAEHDPTSFYAQFRHLSEPETRVFAVRVWQAINLPNLREHIVKGRDVA